jgi:hypothetical protein
VIDIAVVGVPPDEQVVAAVARSPYLRIEPL